MELKRSDPIQSHRTMRTRSSLWNKSLTLRIVLNNMNDTDSPSYATMQLGVL